jgi:hypothetical protein
MPGASKAQRAKTAKRRTDAIKMRTAGADWQQIADQLGYASRGAACTDVTRAMEKYVAEEAAAVEVHRHLLLARLERLLVANWPRALQGDTQASEVCRKIVMDISKTLGLEAPKRHELLTIDAIDAQIAHLVEELASTDDD